VQAAAWLGSWLRGCADLERATNQSGLTDTKVHGLDGRVRVATAALPALRADGGRDACAVLSAPGLPLGLAGEASGLACSRGGAVIVLGDAPVALVPGEAATWQALPADFDVQQVPPLSAARQELREAMREATEDLARLDVAADPEARSGLERATDRVAHALTPDATSDSQSVLATAMWLLAVTDRALTTVGASVTAREVASRHEALTRLDQIARTAASAALIDRMSR
jgi:hypothetical protein